MKRIRTFIALDPGEAIREQLVALQRRLSDIGVDAKWVEQENLHLTLLFLGEVEYTDVPRISETVRQVAAKHASFAMTIAGAGCFPNPRRPRVLWVGVQEGKEQVIALHDDLEGALERLGCYRREERRYQPHLTLGRIAGKRQVPNPSLGRFLEEHKQWTAGEVLVEEVHVMSSELTPRGPIYTPLAHAALR